MMNNIEKIRTQFPILQQTINNHPLVYFDNAATSQKPNSVIDAITNYYRTTNSNVHRGTHALSARATEQYENTRKAVQQFINASSEHEIIFTKGTTESINLVATTFGKMHVRAGDNIVITEMEHHSNILPWQVLCQQQGANLHVIPVLPKKGELDHSNIEKLFTAKTKLLAITHVSNTLGTINPIQKLITLAHKHNVPVLIDGAQAVSHLPVDVQALDCDFYAFSGHKMYGPTGTGVLFAKQKHLQTMPPYQTGGDMIHSVSFTKTEFAEPPHKFEAGTPNIAGVIGLSEAITFIQSIGFPAIQKHESGLVQYAHEQLQTIPRCEIIGTTMNKVGVVSFHIPNIHPHDIATLLDQKGIAIRAGHHCTQPLMNSCNIPGTARISFAIYNTKEEVDMFIQAMHGIIETFKE